MSANRIVLAWLSEREANVLLLVAEGDDNDQIAARLGVTRASVHQTEHRIRTKWNVGGRNDIIERGKEYLMALAGDGR